MGEKVLIFGTGGVGKKAKKKLEEDGKTVIGFLDNDEQKWNQEFEQCKIFEPASLEQMEYDFIAIGVYKAVTEIKEQLVALGVLEDKIIVPVEPNRIFPLEAVAEGLQKVKEEEYSSDSTQYYLARKIVIQDKEFLEKIEDLKSVLDENNISRDKVCVVSGAVLQAYGLRESKKFDDIDIIMTSDLRKIYGTGLVIVSASAEMHPQNEYDIADDEIIMNVSNHFVFKELKFMNLDILQRNMK